MLKLFPFTCVNRVCHPETVLWFTMNNIIGVTHDHICFRVSLHKNRHCYPLLAEYIPYFTWHPIKFVVVFHVNLPAPEFQARRRAGKTAGEQSCSFIAQDINQCLPGIHMHTQKGVLGKALLLVLLWYFVMDAISSIKTRIQSHSESISHNTHTHTHTHTSLKNI